MSLRSLSFILLCVCILGAAAADAADLTMRLDAREVARKRIRTEMTLAVSPGATTLVFPKWIPGEHSPSGPLDSMIGLEIRANGQPVAWTRDPLEMYALRVDVPRGAQALDIALDSGLSTDADDGGSTTSSDQLAVLPLNEFVLLPKGSDADRISTLLTVVVPPGWGLACALDAKPVGENTYELETASLTAVIDSPVQMGRYTKRI